MLFSTEMNIYYEDLWIWYPLYLTLCLLIPFLFIFFSYFKIKKLNNICKIKFKYIMTWLFFLVINEVIFLAFLPMFNIWVLQKEQILFFIPFIFITWYSINKYHFIDIKYWIWRSLIFLSSLWISVLLTNLVKIFYYDNSEGVIGFWLLSNHFWVADCIISIIVFIITNNILTNFFLWDNINEKFYKQLSIIKKKIPFITNITDLNYFLWLKFLNVFKIKNVSIYIFKEEDQELEIFKYFNKNILNDFFINDILFIEENKYKFNLNKINKEIEKDTFLILPIRNNKSELIWIFSLWNQSFKDNYSTENINHLKSFVGFLEWHLKYLKIYNDINYLNLSLDKKVDEKTIEYNNLINKQKEFINMISHEIKWPIWSTLLQWECVLDDIKDWKYDKEYLLREVWIMNKELLKTWNLANKLFDIAIYDTKDIKLYIENINLSNLLIFEVDRYIRNNKNVVFNLNIDENISYVNLDKVQFTQVIDNLLTNAVKFLKNDNWYININCYLKDENIFLEIEDNWIWFKEIDIVNIFDKYSTWKVSWIWLWMWLYLCKKIVELHRGTIDASLSKNLWWAKFVINIPFNK